MKIVVVGRGNVGGGLARLWQGAGHEVVSLGREVTEQLIRDAGFEPVYAGDLDNARTVEDHIAYTMMLARSELGPHFYRLASPGKSPAIAIREPSSPSPSFAANLPDHAFYN